MIKETKEMNKNKLLVRPVNEQDVDYLQDESKYYGTADTISFPENVSEIKEIIREVTADGGSITVQGALTGITGAAVPEEGHILNMKNMNHVLSVMDSGLPEVRAEAGVTVEQLEREVRKATGDRYYFPMIPTEKTATLGGMVSSGARGLQSYCYGGCKKYIKEIEICGRKGETILVKEQDKDCQEIYASEGMLGVITSLTLRLVEKPACQWGILFFFRDDGSACSFVDLIDCMGCITAIEYMDRQTTAYIGRYQKHMSSISCVPDIPEWAKALIYVEIAGNIEEELEECAALLIEKCEESGGSPDDAWAMSGEEEMEILRAYRHAASECVNMLVSENHRKDKQITKISVDIEWKDKKRLDMIEFYREQMKKTSLSYCIFGHIGQKCPYVNIIASNKEEYELGRKIVRQWEKKAYEEGGEIFKEHGVGKLKKAEYCEIVPVKRMSQKLKIKANWDPEGVFNPGNMFQSGR